MAFVKVIYIYIWMQKESWLREKTAGLVAKFPDNYKVEIIC